MNEFLTAPEAETFTNTQFEKTHGDALAYLARVINGAIAVPSYTVSVPYESIPRCPATSAAALLQYLRNRRYAAELEDGQLNLEWS